MALRIPNGTPITPVRPGVDKDVDGRQVLRSVKCRCQDKTFWCWAAVVQMILGHFKAAVHQCELATVLFRARCCRGADNAICNKGATAEQVLCLVEDSGRRGRIDPRALPFDAVQDEIREGRPVGVYLDSAGGGHFVLIRGWDTAKGEMLLVCDPKAGPGVVAQSTLEVGPANRTWELSIVGLQ